ncbi:La- protein 6, partial [Branchiostoma belcheri]
IMKRERCSQEVELDSSHRCTKPSKSGSLSQNVRAPESTGEQLGQLTSNTTSNSRFKARTPSPGLPPPPEEPEEDAVLSCFSDRAKSLMCSTMEKKGAWQQTAKLNRNHRLKARSPSPPEEPEEDTALTCRGDSHRTLMRCTPRRKGPQRPTGNTAQVRFKARTPSPCLPPPPEQPEEDVTPDAFHSGEKGVQQTIKRRHKKQEFGPTHSGFDDKLDSDKKVATEREVVFRPKTARGRRVLKDSTSDSKQRSSGDTKGPTQLLVVHPDEEPADKANRFKARTPSPCLSPPPECLTQKETGDNGLLTCLGDTTPSLKLSADGRKLVPMTQKDAGNLLEGAGFTPKPPPRKKYAVADPEEVATEKEVVFRPKTARGRKVPRHPTPDSQHRSSSDTKGSTQLLVVHPDEEFEPAGKIRFKARTPSPCLSPPPEYLTQEESVDNGLLTCLGDTKPSLKLSADGRKLVPMTQKDAGNLLEGAGFTPNPPRRKKCAAADVTSPPPGQRPSSRAQIMKRERCKQQTEVNSSHRLTKWSKSENLSQSVRVEEPKCEQARQKNHNTFKGRTRARGLLPPINACADAAGISLRGKHASDDMRRRGGDNRLNRVRLPPINKKS